MAVVPPLSYPGVYVQEVPSGVHTITGVSTSIAAFVGMMRRGRLGVPTRVLSFADYERKFGTDTATSEMTDQVRQFFLNGGREAWITRIASGAACASVTLKNEANDEVLTVTAREAGPDGNLVRVEVDYDTSRPEHTFNLRAFQIGATTSVAPRIEADENFPDLSMNRSDRRYIETVINEQSALIEVKVVAELKPSTGFSLAGLLLDSDVSKAVATLRAVLDPNKNTNTIQISVDGDPFVPVSLPPPSKPPDRIPSDWKPLQALEEAINQNLTTFSKRVRVDLVPEPQKPTYLRIRSVKFDGTDTPGGSVEIQPAPENDAAAALQLGVAQGGVEVSGYATLRPAPTGFFAKMGSAQNPLAALTAFTSASSLGAWTLSYDSGASSHSASPIFAAPNNPMYKGTVYTGAVGVGSLQNVRENLQRLVESINNGAKSQTGESTWQASLQGYRLVLHPLSGGVNADTTATLNNDGTYKLGDKGQFFDATANVAAYSLGSTGLGNFQQPGLNGTPGDIPDSAEYRSAFDKIARDVDLFNLLILPRAKDQTDNERRALWGMASTFCQKHRAFLFIDPPKA